MILFKKDSVTDEKEMELHPFTNQDDNDSLLGKLEDAVEFYAINRRITHGLCLPLLDDISSIYYCAFAKLPGMWIASALREEYKHLLVDKKAIDKPNLVYSRQEHVVETCLRSMIGQQLLKVFGRLNYSMTYYLQHEKNYLLRLSIPHEDNFMFVFNANKNLLEDFEILFPDSYWKIIRDPENREELKRSCMEAFQARQNQTIKDGVMHPIFSSGRHKPELNKFLQKCFCTSKIIRTAILGTIDSGVIFGYYVKENLKPLFGKHDQYEYFVEFASRIKMRHGIEQFFGDVNFVLTVYDNVATMAIPIEIKKDKSPKEVERFLLLLSLETVIKKEDGDIELDMDEMYFPSSMKDITKHINELNMDYLTTGL